MANSEIAGLTEDTTPDSTDNIYAQDAAGNTDKRVPLSALPISTATQTALDAKLATATAASTYQPLDSDLTAIAALTTTTFGRALLEAANAAALRTTLNVEDGATADQSAAEILAALLTVDGAGSGLDADLLDGQSSAFYATASSVSDHLADTADAHDASAVSVTPAGENTDVEVQAAIDTLFTRTARITDLDDLRVAQVFIDDFRSPNTVATRIGETQWDSNIVGTGAVADSPLTASGSCVALSGTAVNDESEIVAYFPTLTIGVMTMRWYLSTGPGTAGQAYVAEWGWQDPADASPNGAWFRVTNNVASPDPVFVCVTSDGTTEQTTTTAVTATDSTFFETEITHDGAGTYRFYVNGVLVATHSTTVPGIALMYPLAKILKSVGSGTARTMTIDYCAIRMEVAR